MSYWVSIDAYGTDDNGEPYNFGTEVNVSWNYTKMFKHLPCGLVKDWDGKKVKDLADVVIVSLEELENNSEKYRKYEASNGWGTVETAIQILENLKEGMLDHPNGEISIC